MMRSVPLLPVLGLALFGLTLNSGCVNARAPDVYINTGGPPPQDVDSARVPPTATHEEARAELETAYRQIRYLEHENRRLAKKLEKEKDRADEYKRKYKRLKDKYDD